MSATTTTRDHSSLLRTAVAYVAMIVGAILLFLAIRHFGERLSPPAVLSTTTAAAVAAARPAGHGANPLLHVLISLTAVVALGRLLGHLFTWINQPAVIGEVVAGILLGPSLLGAVSPAAMEFVLPQTTAPFLSIIAQVGIILYMFVVGLELNAAQLRQQAHSAIAISHASIVAPFILGAGLAVWLYSALCPAGVSFTAFALFMGIAMSITAFPVLARILTDRRMHKTELGTIALTCAASDDVTAWCLLAFVVGVVQSQLGGAFWVAAGTVAFVLAMFFVVRPLLARYLDRTETITPNTLAIVLVLLLSSAVTTELIGIHAIFGAFLLGAIIPHDSPIARAFTEKLQDLVAVLLLPAFFAYTGMRTQIGLLNGWEQWLVCGAVILVATLGKFGGTLAAARLTGSGWRESAALGILMNTRGLMELIVLNIGLDLGVISPTLFAIMVLMAIVTTMTTSPLLQWLMPNLRNPGEPQASAHCRMPV